MRIAYVAKHGLHDNCDEDAIGYCLKTLGHEVYRLPETCTAKEVNGIFPHWCLFHKWENIDAIRNIRCKKAFWYFDLVESDDWVLKQRSVARQEWFLRVQDNVDKAFMTDGDWAAKHGLNWLMQGADPRKVGAGTPDGPTIDILFTGSIIHGGKRMSFVQEMTDRYGKQFVAFGHKVKERVHGEALANLYARAKIIVAPDGPVTDRYWSNRIYLTLGFGGFLMHPECSKLSLHYTPGIDFIPYKSREELHTLIEMYLKLPAARDNTAWRGLQKTKSSNTYMHRCEELIKCLDQ